MRATVIYESSFGNTRQIAETVAQTLGAELAPATGAAPHLDEVDLLVVGAPTQAWGLPGRRTRQSAVDEGGKEADPAHGVREVLDELPPAHGRYAAAFDTRFDKPAFLTGSAAKGIASRLRHKGFELLAPPESFFVVTTKGPLKDGEPERAAEWAAALRDQVEDVEGLPVGSH